MLTRENNDSRILETLPVGLLACNCVILGDRKTHEAIVIDPGDEVERIHAILESHALHVNVIVSTHTHIDHVGGLARLHELTGAPVYFHRDDLELYRHLDLQAQWLGVAPPPVTPVENFLKEGDRLSCGAWRLEVLHTPGHTEGSISLYVPKDTGVRSHRLEEIPRTAPFLFAGDTLFAGSIGRTDLWGGSLKKIMRSLREKLLLLPDETLVIPGHGPETTIGEERAANPFLRGN